MNRPLSLLLRGLGLNRPAPTTRLGRCLRRSERTLSALAVIYLGLQAFPQVMFAHSVTAHGITFYSRAPIPSEAALCADRAAGLIQQSELAEPEHHERVFVCDSPWVFGLFTPGFGSRAFAFSIPLTDNVFIAAADFSRDKAYSGAPTHNVRSLSCVTAHEITHGLIRHQLGFWRGVRLPAWVAEGYCDYIARESSFPEDEGLRMIASGQGDASRSFQYFEYRQMVRCLMEDKHLSFEQVVGRAGEFAAVKAETRQALRGGNSQ